MVGQFFMPAFQKVLRFGSQALTLLRDLMERLNGFIDKVGGSERVLAVLSATLAALFGLISAGKLAGAVAAFTKLAASFSLTAAKAALAFSAVLLLVLLVQDFISFMRGEDSLIGVMLEKTGVDCKVLHLRIVTVMNRIKAVFTTAAATIKSRFGGVFSTLRQFWEDNGEAIAKGVSDAVTGMVDKLDEFSKWLSDNWGTITKVAGAVLKFVGVFLVAKDSVQKIVGTVGKTVEAVKGIGTALKALTNPAGIAVVAIAAIAAVLFDLFNFINGKDSVIGTVLGSLGVDVEAVREKVTEAWNKVQDFLLTAWGVIESVCASVWGGIQDFFEQHGDEIKTALTTAWEVITTVLTTAWNVIQSVAETVFGGLRDFWAEHGEQIKTALSNAWTAIQNLLTTVWNVIQTVATAVFGALKTFWDNWGGTIVSVFSGIWETVQALFGAAFDVLTDIFAIFAALFAGDWSSLWENVKQLASDIWNGILDTISAIMTAVYDVLSSIWSGIWDFIFGVAQSIFDTLSTTFSNILSSITEKVGQIKDSIVNGFQAAIDWITALPAQALQWGRDIIDNIISGIKGAVNGIGEAVSGVAGKIKSFLGFSEPEDGPLSDFHTYMPDMMNLMSQGIDQGKGGVQAAVQAVAQVIETVMNQLPAKALRWGMDIGQAIARGLSASMAAVRNQVADLANSIHAYVGFSEPEAGPLSNFHTYMPDMIDLMVAGINAGKTKVRSAAEQLAAGLGGSHSGILSAAKDLSVDMTVLTRSATPSLSTVNTATTNTSTTNRTVTQNVEINQEFHGDAAAQKNIARAADSAADDTTGALARALAYAG